jgi:hypothetical protein
MKQKTCQGVGNKGSYKKLIWQNTKKVKWLIVSPVSSGGKLQICLIL